MNSQVKMNTEQLLSDALQSIRELPPLEFSPFTITNCKVEGFDELLSSAEREIRQLPPMEWPE